MWCLEQDFTQLHGLLPHEAKEKMKLMSNQTEMAAYFLDHVIHGQFIKLLDVMWMSEDDHVARMIWNRLTLTEEPVNSEIVFVAICACVCACVVVSSVSHAVLNGY